MRLLFLALMTCACLAACASKVTLTEQQSRLAAQLSQQDAEAILRRAFERTNDQSGLFSSSAAAFMTNPEILQIESSVVHYRAAATPGAAERAAGDAGPVFKFDLRNLKSVRVVSRSAVNPVLTPAEMHREFGDCAPVDAGLQQIARFVACAIEVVDDDAPLT